MFCFLVLISMFGISGYLFASSIVNIKVTEKTEVETDKVRLGDIAEIRGEDRALVNELETVVMGSAPLPGKSRLLDKEYIRIRLKQQGIDLSQINLQDYIQRDRYN